MTDNENIIDIRDPMLRDRRASGDAYKAAGEILTSAIVDVERVLGKLTPAQIEAACELSAMMVVAGPGDPAQTDSGEVAINLLDQMLHARAAANRPAIDDQPAANDDGNAPGAA